MTRIEAVKSREQEVNYRRSQSILYFGHDVTTNHDFDSIKGNASLSLVNNFIGLADACEDADGEFFSQNCDAAGAILFYLGWDCETPDQLEASLRNFCEVVKTHYPSILTNEFLTKVLEVKSRLRREAGSNAPQESLSAPLLRGLKPPP